MRPRVNATITRPMKEQLRIIMERDDMSESMAVRVLLEEALNARSANDANKEKAA